jgi:hypothetical protein
MYALKAKPQVPIDAHMARISLPSRVHLAFSHTKLTRRFSEATPRRGKQLAETLGSSSPLLCAPQPSFHHFTHISPHKTPHLTPEPQTLASNANASFSLVLPPRDRQPCPSAFGEV